MPRDMCAFITIVWVVVCVLCSLVALIRIVSHGVASSYCYLPVFLCAYLLCFSLLQFLRNVPRRWPRPCFLRDLVTGLLDPTAGFL